MSEVLTLVLCFFIGSVLGIIFFAGLWWTVRKLVTSNSSPYLFIGSWLLRMSISLYGFYEVTVFFPGDSRLLYLLMAVLGFVAARSGVNRFVQRGRSCI